MSQTTPPTPPLFQAFQARRASRTRWITLVALVAGAYGLWTLAHMRATTDRERRVAARGIQAVHEGMTIEEVGGVMGNPFAVQQSQDGKADCYQYGHPTFEKPEFPVYSLCYADGRLRDMRVRRFTLTPVGPGGTLFPLPDSSPQGGKL